MARRTKDKLTVNDIVSLRWELDKYYRQWHDQQREDEAWYNAGTSGIKIVATNMPDGFIEVKPPTGKTIVDTAAEFASGNFPKIHVPRRVESAEAQKQSERIGKWVQGFWYRAIAEAPQNPLRAWAQHGALRGAICACLLFDEEKWPDVPPKTDEDYDEISAERKTSWPFFLDYVDPINVYPDPSTEGKEYVIIAFTRMAHEVKRRWPDWNMKIPGRPSPVKLTDSVDFIAYWDRKNYAYIVSGGLGQESYGGIPMISAYGGVPEHGYGFLPYFFTSSGYGMPTGKPEMRYQGFLTPIRSLLEVEARRMTQMDAVIAQQAMPWIVAKEGVKLDMSLQGVTRVPMDAKVTDSIMEMRPQVPIEGIITELGQLKGRIDAATIPDSLAGARTPGVYSGYHQSVLVGTGRNRLRPLSDSLERTVEWASSGALKIIDNKIKGPVSVWGRGMKANEFISLNPEQIDGAYEVYASLMPDLPQDTQVNINNGSELFKLGAIPKRDLLQTYAGRENAEDLLVERMVEDVAGSQQSMAQMTADALAGFGMPQGIGGGQSIPGVRNQVGVPGEGGQNPTTQAAGPNGGITGIPTPPGQSQAPGNTAGPLQGLSRGANAKGGK